jgi:hypothetical protein
LIALAAPRRFHRAGISRTVGRSAGKLYSGAELRSYLLLGAPGLVGDQLRQSTRAHRGCIAIREHDRGHDRPELADVSGLGGVNLGRKEAC